MDSNAENISIWWRHHALHVYNLRVCRMFSTKPISWHNGKWHTLLFTNNSSSVDWENFSYHYNNIIMSAVASQITSLTIVYSIVYSGADERKSQSSASLAYMCVCVWGGGGDSPVTGEFFAQRASNAENVSIWWRHHVFLYQHVIIIVKMLFLVVYSNFVLSQIITRQLGSSHTSHTSLHKQILYIHVFDIACKCT